MRKVIIISGILILIAAAGYMGFKYYMKMNEKPVIQTFSTQQNPAFKAVPQKCPLILEIKNTEGFRKELEGKHPIITELKGIPEINELFSKVIRFYEFAGNHSGIQNLLKGKSVIISINPSGKNQLTSLYLVQMNDESESNSAAGIVTSDLRSQYTITSKNYDNTPIYNAKSLERSFFYTCVNDIFMVSEDFILLEQAIRQTNSLNLLNNHEFTELYKTIEENAFVNIFINHLTVPQLLAKFVSPEIRQAVGQLNFYSNWSELDLWMKPSEMEMNGFSMTKDSSDNYLNIFKNQAAQKMTIEKAIPANASYFVALNLKNTNNYIDQFETYIKANGNYYPREMDLSEFQKKTKTDPIHLFKEIVGTQFAGVYTNINKSNPEQNRFFVAEIMDASVAKEKIGKAVSEFNRLSQNEADKQPTKFSVDTKNSFNIYRLPISNLAQSVFGRAFAGINGNYFVLYKKYLIWGDNLPGMKSYLQSLNSERTLANDSIYKEYSKNGQPKANFYVYAKVRKVFRLKEELLKPELSANLSTNEEVIHKFSTFSWQLSVSGNMVENRIKLKYDPNLKEEPQAIWQLKLDAPLAQIPKMVLNHKDLVNREMIVCDKENNVYLINKEGSILWKMSLPDAIVSEIHQIDIYQNQKFQYLFNTRTQLYVVDRMGNKVGKFPVVLKSMASNGVAVAQYGQNKEFRFFIAGEDKKIYVYDYFGKLIPKWNFEGAASMVTKPIQHFDIEGKDYIVFSDQQNTYFLDRQGKSREIQTTPFNHSGNPLRFISNEIPRLITTDQSGKIYIQDFTGQTEVKEVGKFGSGHRFAAEDIDGDGSLEYLFADGKKLTAFTNAGQKLFERTFSNTISETPSLYNLAPGAIKIGVVVKGENKIYLLDKNGSITWGFPLPGNTPFVLGKFNDSSSYFNLLVGSEDGTVINYKIE